MLGHMPQMNHHLFWRSESVAKLMQDKKIHDRGQLALKIHRPYSTVQRTISADWSGPITSNSVLVAMAITFGVPLNRLVREPKDARS